MEGVGFLPPCSPFAETLLASLLSHLPSSYPLMWLEYIMETVAGYMIEPRMLGLYREVSMTFSDFPYTKYQLILLKKFNNPKLPHGDVKIPITRVVVSPLHFGCFKNYEN